MESNKLSKNFALIGAAGFVAPRHMQAIKDTKNKLVAAFDPFERFDRHMELLCREGDGRKIEYISVCSSNYLPDAHIRFALRTGAHPNM